MATLKDVAKDASVSIATVSCCISGAKNVKPETKAKIMASIEKTKIYSECFRTKSENILFLEDWHCSHGH